MPLPSFSFCLSEPALVRGFRGAPALCIRNTNESTQQATVEPGQKRSAVPRACAPRRDAANSEAATAILEARRGRGGRGVETRVHGLLPAGRRRPCITRARRAAMYHLGAQPCQRPPPLSPGAPVRAGVRGGARGGERGRRRRGPGQCSRRPVALSMPPSRTGTRSRGGTGGWFCRRTGTRQARDRARPRAWGLGS